MPTDEESAPLLSEQSESSQTQRPSSSKSNTSKRSNHTTESTPLLAREATDDRPRYVEESEEQTPASHSLRSISGKFLSKPKRWPSVIALFLLSIVVILILVLGFIAPSVVEQYANEAVTFEPTHLSIESFTSTGVRARVQGDFYLDAAKVHQKPVRDLGRAGTWIAREIETSKSHVVVYLPEYGNIELGYANLPPVKVNVRNGHVNHLDIVADLTPGDVSGFRTIAKDWIDGRLDSLKVKGKADFDLKSGLLKLGSQTVIQSLTFESDEVPAIPKFDISKLNIHEVPIPGAGKGMAADASVSVEYKYPFAFVVPPLGFDILVRNCAPDQPNLLLADATTSEINVVPNHDVTVDVGGVIRDLPKELTEACPGSKTSPLDMLVGDYIQGLDTTIFVRGSNSPSADTPGWISDLTKSITVPLPFPGRQQFGDLIKNFTMTNVHFGLPDPFADPDTPEAQPKFSALLKVLVGLPSEMNFSLDVSKIRTKADVFYHGDKLGYLDLHKWQKAFAKRVTDDDGAPGLLIEADVQDAPLQVTNDDVFTEVVQRLLFGGKGVTLLVKANVDAQTDTALGNFVVRDIPAEGEVEVNPIGRGGGSGGGGLSGLKPKIGGLEILRTTKTSITLRAVVNITNPTAYSANVPFANISIMNNGTVLGHATVKDMVVVPGQNDNLEVEAVWDPSVGGKLAMEAGRNFISEYISGFNTTLTFKTHEGTIPAQPALGRALSVFELSIPTPSLRTGNGEKDGHDSDGPHFIKDATMHLLTSTAVFTLLSPLPRTTIYITSIDATAFYNHTEPVGHIDYDLPFAVTPGASQTPRLPVDWSIGGVGYDAVRSALGGSLKLDAKADIGIRVEDWETSFWFVGGGIGAKVRL